VASGNDRSAVRPGIRPRRIGGRPAALLTFAVVGAVALSACGGGSGGSSSTKSEPDNGTQLTMWVRAATDQFSQRLVDEYNKSHKNQVKLTIVPNDSYLAKVGAAAGSNSLPDILASDVVYTPNYTKQGLFQDISAEIKALPYASSLAKSHLDVSSFNGKTYAVPHKLDSSVLFYNKDLFKKAGLDPEKAPKNFDEILTDARAINKLGGDIKGFDLAGNCGGCGVYTLFPYAWADGTNVLSSDGKKVDLNNDSFRKVFQLYKTLSDEKLVPSGAKSQDGSTWPAAFEAGKVGILPLGSPIVGDLLKQTKFQWGVTSLMSPDGSKTSTFIGGDVAGISHSTKHKAQAWDFLKWTLDDNAQVEIIAKNGDLPGRTDLSGNKYTAADPRTKLIADGLKNGVTPFALPFGDIFNNPNGPWVATIRAALYGNDIGKALADGQTKIQSALDAAG
jgi:multiple sugar transport system substrate-binding protein